MLHTGRSRRALAAARSPNSANTLREPRSRRAQRDRLCRPPRDVGLRFASRYPDEAETLLDESITLWRETLRRALERPRCRLASSSPSWRKRATGASRPAGQATRTRARVAARLAKAETFFQEAITRQRQAVSRFASPRTGPSSSRSSRRNPSTSSARSASRVSQVHRPRGRGAEAGRSRRAEAPGRRPADGGDPDRSSTRRRVPQGFDLWRPPGRDAPPSGRALRPEGGCRAGRGSPDSRPLSRIGPIAGKSVTEL